MHDSPSSSDATRDVDLTHVTRGEFISAMVHLYRGQLGEASAWRTRIDATSNWAVVVSVTALSFVFGGSGSERHLLIPIVVAFCTFLLLMESRRYRYYDIWRTRARDLEINFYRPLLNGSPPLSGDWQQVLAHDLEWPHPHMPWWEASGRRLRRNYQWIYAVLLMSWLVVLTSYPTPTTTWDEVTARAAVGPLPGPLIIAVMISFYAGLVILGGYSFYASRYTPSLPAGHPGRLDPDRHDYL